MAALQLVARPAAASGPQAPTHLKVGFDEFEYGFVYRRVREDTTEDDELWTVGRVCLWPNCLYTGDHFEWRVPIDDENTLQRRLVHRPGARATEPFEQERIPYWYAPIDDPQTGRWITSHVMNQDFVAWVGQGTIADRTQEHLGESDRGVILIRKRMLEEAAVVARGGEPKAVVRDPRKNHRPAPAAHPRGARRAGAPARRAAADGVPRRPATGDRRGHAARLGRAQERLTMATLAGVFNMSHSPFCYMPPEKWNEVRASRSLRADVPDGRPRGRIAAKAARVATAFATLQGRSWRPRRPDVLVVFGDDQLECFDFGNYPSFADLRRRDVSRLARRRRQRRRARPSRPWPRPCSPASCSAASIPPSRMDMPKPERGIGHAFLRPAESLTDFTLPIVPVFLNCYYAPQPTALRCYQLGAAVREIIDDAPGRPARRRRSAPAASGTRRAPRTPTSTRPSTRRSCRRW